MLEIVVFLCGAAVMILEIAGARVLAPFLGTSTVVWTGLIGIVLASLSVGYWLGGRLADRRPSPRALGGIILLAALTTLATALSKTLLLEFLSTYSAGPHLAVITANLLLFAPPSLFLGMVSPYAVRLKLAGVEQAGRTSGNLYALSTAGSILGTFAAGFVLIAYLGSTTILFLVAGILAVASFLACRADAAGKAAVLVLVILGAAGSASYDRWLAASGFFDADTRYNRILVFESRDTATNEPTRVMLTHPRHVQSAMFLERPTDLALAYTRFFMLAGHFAPGARRMLLLGGGAYSFPRHLLATNPEATIDVVELDPGVTRLAEEHFGLVPDERLRIFHEDARTFLNRNTKKYDAILGDIFNAHYAVPFHVVTREAAQRVFDALSDDGVVIVNIITAISGNKGRFLRAVRATYADVFPTVALFPLGSPNDTEGMQNVMLVAKKNGPLPETLPGDPELALFVSRKLTAPLGDDVPILTDEFAPVERYVTAWW
ncbi:MAG: fused MFS/spermidine synthase [Desulfovibrionaceae bacterium]|nr:fused MFS/spermidine synthase [Desulfovibrionaceae bacterium]